MKKHLAILLLCLLTLTACTKNLDNIPALSLVQSEGVEWAQEKLVGYSREALTEIWGEPLKELRDGHGDVWYLDEKHTGRITVYYDAEGKVETLLMDTAPGQEGVPADEPSGVAPPEPGYYPELTEPPALTVTCGGESVTVGSGGVNWVTAMPDGTMGVICADAPHPSQMRELLGLHLTEETRVVLTFTTFEGDMELIPEELWVRAWDYGYTSDCDCAPREDVTFGENGELELLPGAYIYEVIAKWGDGESSGGTAIYAFCIEKKFYTGWNVNS